MRIEYSEGRNNGRLRQLRTAFTIYPDDPTPTSHCFRVYINWERTDKQSYSFTVESFQFSICSAGFIRHAQLFSSLEKEFTAGKFADFTKSEDRKKAGYHLLGFLFLQPGDTDAEYFEKFNKAEMDFILKHGPEINMILEGESNE